MSDGKKHDYAVAIKVANELVAILEPFCERVQIAGSLRRKKQLVGDIELLFIPRIETRQADMFTVEPMDVADEKLNAMLVAGDLAKRPNVNGTFAWGKKNKLAILIAAAQYPDGVTDQQIAVLTGYKNTSRKEYKRQLKGCGYLVERDGFCWATEAGIKWLGPAFEPLPVGDALREYWMRRLTGGELSLFKAYVDIYPESIELDAMMEATGYKQTSVKEYRRQLAARQLITGNRASDNLFS